MWFKVYSLIKGYWALWASALKEGSSGMRESRGSLEAFGRRDFGALQGRSDDAKPSKPYLSSFGVLNLS